MMAFLGWYTLLGIVVALILGAIGWKRYPKLRFTLGELTVTALLWPLVLGYFLVLVVKSL